MDKNNNAENNNKNMHEFTKKKEVSQCMLDGNQHDTARRSYGKELGLDPLAGEHPCSWSLYGAANAEKKQPRVMRQKKSWHENRESFSVDR